MDKAKKLGSPRPSSAREQAWIEYHNWNGRKITITVEAKGRSGWVEDLLKPRGALLGILDGKEDG